MRRDKERASGARCRLSRAKRSTREKSRKSGAAVGAFIAYGSAKHLWNNGAAKYIVGEEKRKYLARERTHKIGFYCSLPACRSFICTHICRGVRSIRFSVSIPALAIAPAPAETEGKKSASRFLLVIRIFCRSQRDSPSAAGEGSFLHEDNEIDRLLQDWRIAVIKVQSLERRFIEV